VHGERQGDRKTITEGESEDGVGTYDSFLGAARTKPCTTQHREVRQRSNGGEQCACEANVIQARVQRGSANEASGQP